MSLLETIADTQADGIEDAAQRIAGVVKRERVVHTFGCGHSGLLAQEIFFRSAGLMTVSYIHGPGQTLDVRPVRITVISSSGRNSVPIEVAIGARERGAFVIALCSMAIAESGVESRHESGTLLHQHADLILDNHLAPGDAMVDIEKFPQRVGPMSTIVGAALLQSAVARAIEICAEETTDLPVFINANVDGGTEHNERWLGRLEGKFKHL